MTNAPLIVPVYLNQRIVFDLLAMLQGGISTVTAISRTENAKQETAEQARASFGLSQVLSSLLKIDVSGETKSTKGDQTGLQTNEERVHTPASLLFILRNLLTEQKVIKTDIQGYKPVAGDLLEFKASLRRNPIIETLDAMAQLMDIAAIFSEQQKPQKGKTPQQAFDPKKMQAQMIKFGESLKSGNSVDLTADKTDSGYRAIITVETQYLNDPTMADLVDGSFTVLGKVIRSIEGDDDAISLIRKTAMSKMPLSLLTEAFGHLSALGSESGFAIPELKWDITGPAVQVIPIAIYA